MRSLTLTCVGFFLLAAGLAGCDQPKARGPGAEGMETQLVRLLTRQPPPPAAPAWAQALMGRPLAQALPGGGTCVGNTDQARAETGALAIDGWGWDVSVRQPIARVVLTDAAGRIIGAGDGGLARPDVPAARPDIPDGATGWTARTGRREGEVRAHGITSAGETCGLGGLFAPKASP